MNPWKICIADNYYIVYEESITLWLWVDHLQSPREYGVVLPQILHLATFLTHVQAVYTEIFKSKLIIHRNKGDVENRTNLEH